MAAPFFPPSFGFVAAAPVPAPAARRPWDPALIDPALRDCDGSESPMPPPPPTPSPAASPAAMPPAPPAFALPAFALPAGLSTPLPPPALLVPSSAGPGPSPFSAGPSVFGAVPAQAGPLASTGPVAPQATNLKRKRTASEVRAGKQADELKRQKKLTNFRGFACEIVGIKSVDDSDPRPTGDGVVGVVGPALAECGIVDQAVQDHLEGRLTEFVEKAWKKYLGQLR